MQQEVLLPIKGDRKGAPMYADDRSTASILLAVIRLELLYGVVRQLGERHAVCHDRDVLISLFVQRTGLLVVAAHRSQEFAGSLHLLFDGRNGFAHLGMGWIAEVTHGGGQIHRADKDAVDAFHFENAIQVGYAFRRFDGRHQHQLFVGIGGLFRHAGNQLQLVLSLLIVCVVVCAVVFSALNLYTLDATHMLLDDQEQIIHFDSLLSSADQAMTRYVYTGDAANKEEYDQCSQQLLDIAQELAGEYTSLYVYSLKNVTEAYVTEGQKFHYEEEADNNAPILASYSRLKGLSHTMDFFLPYARTHIADEVSQRLGVLEKQQRTLMLYVLVFFILLTFSGFAVIMHIVDRLVVALECLTSFAERISASHWNEALPAKIA